MKAYGALELTQASPAQMFVEPISIVEAKNYLTLIDTSPADTTQDDLIGSLITAAREIAEIHQGKDLIQKQWDLNLDLLLGYDAIAGAAYPMRFNSVYNFGIGYELELRHPLQSVDLLAYKDRDGNTTTLVEGNSADYVVDTNRALVLPPWGKLWPFYTPYPSSSVLVRFTSGYAPTHPFWSNEGQRLIQGMRLLISAWFNGRLPWEPGGISQEMPFAVTALFGYGARPRVH
jgi:hypothetical protein